MKNQEIEMVQIRTYQFSEGCLHLERGTAESMSNEELIDMYGSILSVTDGVMPADKFWKLPDFSEI